MDEFLVNQAAGRVIICHKRTGWGRNHGAAREWRLREQTQTGAWGKESPSLAAKHHGVRDG